MANTSIVELADIISSCAKQLDGYRSQLHQSRVSERDDYDGDQMPADIITARETILGAAARITQVISGPGAILTNINQSAQLSNAVRWLFHFGIFEHVPRFGSAIAMTELATLAGVPLRQLKCHARVAVLHGVFTEPSPENLAHSTASQIIVDDPDQFGHAWFTLERIVPASNAVISATERFGETLANNQTAYNVAFNTDQPFFNDMFSDPQRATKFSGFIRSMSTMSDRHPKYLVSGLDWARYDTVFDIGGGKGHASLALLEAFPSLKQCIVQDLPHPIAGMDERVAEEYPASTSSRIRYIAHDFFQPQRPEIMSKPGPRVFLLRNVLHDWPDEQSITIVRHLADNLQDDDRLVIQDVIMPEPGAVPSLEEQCRDHRKNHFSVTCNELMTTLLNAGERTLKEWEDLLFRANERLVIKAKSQHVGSVWDVIEAGWRD